jgi:hypothetical protein
MHWFRQTIYACALDNYEHLPDENVPRSVHEKIVGVAKTVMNKNRGIKYRLVSLTDY